MCVVGISPTTKLSRVITEPEMLGVLEKPIHLVWQPVLLLVSLHWVVAQAGSTHGVLAATTEALITLQLG